MHCDDSNLLVWLAINSLDSLKPKFSWQAIIICTLGLLVWNSFIKICLIQSPIILVSWYHASGRRVCVCVCVCVCARARVCDQFDEVMKIEFNVDDYSLQWIVSWSDSCVVVGEQMFMQSLLAVRSFRCSHICCNMRCELVSLAKKRFQRLYKTIG